MKYYYAKRETYPGGIYPPYVGSIRTPYARGTRPLYIMGGYYSPYAPFRFFSRLRSTASRHQHCSTGTTNIVIDCISIPPNVGIAIGTMISAPFPVDVSTGSSAISVVAVVIAAGRTRFNPASTTASRISCRVLGSRSRKT